MIVEIQSTVGNTATTSNNQCCQADRALPLVQMVYPRAWLLVQMEQARARPLVRMEYPRVRLLIDIQMEYPRAIRPLIEME